VSSEALRLAGNTLQGYIPGKPSDKALPVGGEQPADMAGGGAAPDGASAAAAPGRDRKNNGNGRSGDDSSDAVAAKGRAQPRGFNWGRKAGEGGKGDGDGGGGGGGAPPGSGSWWTRSVTAWDKWVGKKADGSQADSTLPSAAGATGAEAGAAGAQAGGAARGGTTPAGDPPAEGPGLSPASPGIAGGADASTDVTASELQPESQNRSAAARGPGSGGTRGEATPGDTASHPAPPTAAAIPAPADSNGAAAPHRRTSADRAASAADGGAPGAAKPTPRKDLSVRVIPERNGDLEAPRLFQFRDFLGEDGADGAAPTGQKGEGVSGENAGVAAGKSQELRGAGKSEEPDANGKAQEIHGVEKAQELARAGKAQELTGTGAGEGASDGDGEAEALSAWDSVSDATWVFPGGSWDDVLLPTHRPAQMPRTRRSDSTSGSR